MSLAISIFGPNDLSLTSNVNSLVLITVILFFHSWRVVFDVFVCAHIPEPLGVTCMSIRTESPSFQDIHDVT